MVVGDLGYIHQETKKEIRQKWKVAVVTKLKAGMNLIEPFDAWTKLAASKGRPLNGRPTMKSTKLIVLSRRAMRRFAAHVGKPVPSERILYCADLSETLLGLLPLNTAAAKRLLKQVRSWIEPAQSYEKNQLVSTRCSSTASV